MTALFAPETFDSERLPDRLEVTVPGDPVPQGRGKAARWQAKDGRSGLTVRDPAKSRDWKGRAQALMLTALDALGLEPPFVPAREPVDLEVRAYYRCPQSEERKREPRAERPHLKRGDLDNICKSVKDAGNGVCWIDDSQVCELRASKRIAAQGEPGRVVIVVRRLEEANQQNGGER